MDKKYIVSFIIFLFFFFKHVYSEKIDQIEIFADKFTHDKNNKRIYAVGNVEVIDDNFKILSNEIIYNNDKKIISAKKNIRILTQEGNIIRTQDFVSDNKLENAKSGKSYFYIPQLNEDIFEIKYIPENDRDKELKTSKRYSRFASLEYERRNRTWEIFRSAVFSACEICFDKKKINLMNHLFNLRLIK